MRVILKTFALLLALLPLTFSPQPAPAQEGTPVLAFYYAWFDQNTWTSGQSVDLPAEPYASADRAVIERHVAQAQAAGIDALVQSWYGPQEANNQTETNFRALLDIAAARGFKAAVDVEVTGPFFGDSAAVTAALATLLNTHTRHPAYLRYQGKPVIFFWRQQRFSVEEWAAIRSQVDPDHTTYWIAEGVELDYQAVFDGHHLYSIAWAASPADQLANWSNRVRTYAAQNNTSRLWVATAMPGYDDTRLPRENAFAVPRRNGDYYRETWQAAVASQPDMIIITSFNEWLEGTQLEPSAGYGNLYLDLTRELVTAWRGAPPAQEPPPDGPYIQPQALTNVRGGPDTAFNVTGTLAAGSTAAVTGQTEAGDWWQIAFPAGPDGAGWVSAEVVDFTGDPAAVPVVEAPPVPEPETGPTPTPPASPEPAGRPVVSIPAGGVNVRRGPGLEFDLLGRLDENQTVAVVGQNETGDWWQIEYEAGETGRAWVADAVVDFSGSRAGVPVVTAGASAAQATPRPAATPTPAQPVIAGQVKAADPVNLRAEPSVGSDRVGGLYPGETAGVLAVSQTGDWWRIEFPDAPGGAAWVAAEFVTFQGDRAAVPIFGLGTPTPTPGPTNTPTATPLPPSPTPIPWPATYAPTATSIYQPTAAALLVDRGTPDPAVVELPKERAPAFDWRNLPWGVLSAGVVIAIFWLQLGRRRRKSGRG